MASVHDGTFDQMLPVNMRFATPVSAASPSAGADSSITGQHFLTYRWEKTSVADGTFWIRRIPRPILIVRNQSDAVIASFEPYMLLNAARSEGSLVTKIDFILLPDTEQISLTGHYFAGNEQPLTEVITNWLQELHL